MASRRKLKKNVNYIAGELFTECLVNLNFIPGADRTKTNEVMEKILIMEDEFVRRISHTDAQNAKGYYRKFRNDFTNQVNELIDEIAKLN